MDDAPKRFAGLVRVSTEKQEQKGVSLSAQREHIERAVAQLGGKVVQWYGGQEHGTPDYEKKEVKRLLADAQKSPRPFDAVMVANPERWSRDNTTSKAGLQVFRDHQVRFFIGAAEQDLFDPRVVMCLGMYAEFGEYYASSLARDSLSARIHAAKAGRPTGGKLPFGRTYDKETGQWGIDREKKRLIEQVAERYLAGEGLKAIAEELGMNHSSLHLTLTRRCGDEWTVSFNSKRQNVHETVTMKVPRLLPQKTIRAVLAKVKANKTYEHGQNKNRYLLARVIFCEDCGYAMYGQTNASGTSYYRHALKQDRPCHGLKGWVRADEVEDVVLRHLFNEFGNPAAVEKAVQAAIPNIEDVRKRQERIQALDRMVAKEQKARERVVDLILKGVLKEGEAEGKLVESQERIERWQAERGKLDALLVNIPSQDALKQLAKDVSKAFKPRRRRPSKAQVRMNVRVDLANTDFSRMTWEDKRDLVQRIFSGTTPEGQRMGVYVQWLDGKEKGRNRRYRFTIRGQFIQRTGLAPMTPESLAHLTDPEYVLAEKADAVTKYARQWPPTPR